MKEVLLFQYEISLTVNKALFFGGPDLLFRIINTDLCYVFSLKIYY